MNKADEIRAVATAELRVTAKRFFSLNPEYRSVMLSVAQYWADEADDAVHPHLTASVRSQPLWPHRCKDSVWGDDEEYKDIPGEGCRSCAQGFGYLAHWDDNGAAPMGFEAYCHEAGSQEEPEQRNYLPYAVARKIGPEPDAIEVEVVGQLQRPNNEFHAFDGALDPTWDDPRARELLDVVAASPADDAPRRVIADYFMERDNPRGEYIALALDNTVHDRREELLAQHGIRWIAPLPLAAPACSVRWRRGFPYYAEVLADEPNVEHVLGAPAWATIERLHVHPESACVLHPVMRALRELGPIESGWVDALVDGKPWAIERLEIAIDDQDALAKLASATTLPALRELVVRTDIPDEVASLPRAKWWPQLSRLTVVTRENEYAEWKRRQAELGVPWLAVAERFTDPVDTAGWEVAFGPDGACEVALRGFSPHGSLDALSELLSAIPASPVKLVPSRYYVPSQVDVERLGNRVTL